MERGSPVLEQAHQVAVIACGYWGKNLVRNFHEFARDFDPHCRCKFHKPRYLRNPRACWFFATFCPYLNGRKQPKARIAPRAYADTSGRHPSSRYATKIACLEASVQVFRFRFSSLVASTAALIASGCNELVPGRVYPRCRPAPFTAHPVCP